MTNSVEELYPLLSNKRYVTTIVGERVLGVESEDPILVAALTLGESRAHFPDGNNNSGSSLYLGISSWSRDNESCERFRRKMPGNTRGCYDSCGLGGWSGDHERVRQHI